MDNSGVLNVLKSVLASVSDEDLRYWCPADHIVSVDAMRLNIDKAVREGDFESFAIWLEELAETFQAKSPLGVPANHQLAHAKLAACWCLAAAAGLYRSATLPFYRLPLTWARAHRENILRLDPALLRDNAVHARLLDLAANLAADGWDEENAARIYNLVCVLLLDDPTNIAHLREPKEIAAWNSLLSRKP